MHTFGYCPNQSSVSPCTSDLKGSRRAVKRNLRKKLGIWTNTGGLGSDPGPIFFWILNKCIHICFSLQCVPQVPSYFKTRVIKHIFQRYGWTKTLPMAEEMKLKFSKGSRLPVCQFPNKAGCSSFRGIEAAEGAGLPLMVHHTMST